MRLLAFQIILFFWDVFAGFKNNRSVLFHLGNVRIFMVFENPVIPFFLVGLVDLGKDSFLQIIHEFLY